MRGRRIDFSRQMPLVVLARRGQPVPTEPADSIVVYDDPDPLYRMPRKGFRYVIASPPTLGVWAAAVERGIPMGEGL